MKSIVLLSLLSICVLISNAQSRKDIKNAGIKKEIEWNYDYTNGKEEKVKNKEIVYDERGNKIEIYKYNNEGKLKSVESRKYNDENDKIEVVEYKPTGEIKRKINYKYNEDEKLVEEKYYNASGKLYKTVKYLWDGDFLKTKIVYDNNKRMKNKSEYEYIK
ncbi:MAG: hypothetical protein Kow0068_22900 [Marinilabiliales bacterium]